MGKFKLPFFKINFSFLFLTFLSVFTIEAQEGGTMELENLDIIKNWPRYSDAPNSLYRHLLEQAYFFLEKRVDDVAKCQTLADWKKRQELVQKTLINACGPFPEKTPLNARILKTIKKDGYKVENIVYESLPGYYVTASLFIPDGLKGKSPVIIYVSGHSGNGYRSENYRHVILNLVNKKFIVFAYDPNGQGERKEYYDPATGRSKVGGPTLEHSFMAGQALLTERTLNFYRIWDGVRAVDYLLTRSEIDPSRIGMTGRSGGGYQSAGIPAIDDRIYATAPENHMTSLTRMLQSSSPTDGEQNIFQMCSRGLDHADYMEVRAPKPVLMITTTRDGFNIQGARETAKEVSEVYKAYGKPENFKMVEDDAGHESTRKNNEAMYAFFQKHLNNPGDSTDLDVELIPEEELKVTKTGQVIDSYNGKTVFDFTSSFIEEFNEKLKVSRKNPDAHIQSVINEAKKLSGYREPSEIPDPVLTGRYQRSGYAVEKYFVKGEGDYPIPYLLFVPQNPNGKAVIYLHPSGRVAEASTGGELEWMAGRGYVVLAPDLIGTGETGPGRWGGVSEFTHATNNGLSYRIWYLSMMIGRSITGVRTGDVIRLARVLENINYVKEIYGMARQGMTPVLLHAAAFDTSFSKIVLIEPYSSYRSIGMTRFYNPTFIEGTVPRALTGYDLPDLAASLAPRKLVIINPTDGAGNSSSDSEIILEDINVIKEGYKSRQSDEHLTVIFKKGTNNFYDQIRLSE